MPEPTVQTALAGFNLASKLLSPFADRIKKSVTGITDLTWNRFVSAFDNYIERAVARYSVFMSVAYPNAQLRLEEHYIPLSLMDSRGAFAATISAYPSELVNTLKDLLIVDMAGMGKSTLLRHMFLRCANEECGIPLLIDLRKLSQKTTLLGYIASQLQDLDKEFPSAVLHNVLQQGGFVFFLDGYDEISKNDAEAVTRDIQDFKTKANKNKFIMTSRDEKGLIAFADFQRFSIRPLQKAEAYGLIRRYARQADVAETLISKVEDPANASVQEFLTNPLLVSLLFKSFEYKQKIPLKRHIFYRQVYEALFETHDLSKEGAFQRTKRSGLDIDQFHTVMRALGFLTVHATKIEYEMDGLIDFVRRAQSFCGLQSFAPSDFIQDLLTTVPLIVRDGNYLKWTHRSLQEYFAAAYICYDGKQRQADYLLQMYGSKAMDRYVQVLLLCYDIDPKTFRRTVLRDILLKILNDSATQYTWAHETIPESEILKRREMTSLWRVVLARTKEGTLGKAGRETGPDMFRWHEHARAALRKADATFPDNQCSHAIVDPTVIWFPHQLQTFLTTIQTYEERPFLTQWRAQGVITRDRLAEEPEEYFLTLLDDRTLFANSVENFADINQRLEILLGHRLDLNICEHLLRELESQIADEAANPISFS